MRRDDVRRLLRHQAEEVVDDPSQGFVNGLETRLRAVASTLSDGAAAEAPPSGPRHAGVFRRALLPIALGTGAALLVVGVTDTVRRAVSPRQAELGRAVDSVVIKPGGAAEPAHPGARLANGAIVRTGPSGHVIVGNQSLGPGMEGVVVNGRLHPLPRQEAAGSLPTRQEPSVHSRENRPEARRAAPPSTAPTPPRQPRSGPTVSSPPAHATQLHLAARRTSGGAVGLSWSRYEAASFAGYVILRAEGSSEPAYPRDAIQEVDSSRTSSVDRTPPRTAVTYRVVAVDDAHNVVATSEAVTVSGF